MDMVKNYASSLDSEGVEKIDVKNIDAEGVLCQKDDRGITRVETGDYPDQGNDTIGMAFGIGIALIALILALLFVRRRRARYLREITEIETRAAQYVDDLNNEDQRQYPLTAINVHQCKSHACTSCRHDAGDIAFVKTDGAKLVRNNDAGWSMQKNEVMNQYPNDETDDTSLSWNRQHQTSEI